jgi:hypothetical protein
MRKLFVHLSDVPDNGVRHIEGGSGGDQGRGAIGPASMRTFRSRACFGRARWLWGLEKVVRLCSAAIHDGLVVRAGIAVLKEGRVGDPPGFL